MPPFVNLVPGQVFARDFRVVGPLKEGGMGAVYVVDQLSTGERRALKLMHLNLVADPRQRARFEQEAKIGSLIRSDHVVKVIMAGVDDTTGLPFLAMELLEGTELEAMIASQGRIEPNELSIVLSQLCHALGAAHASGIVHRDLKPENIFIASAQRADVPFTVKVLDFGIAKVVAEMKQGSSTQAVGTPIYMAPEQANPHAPITASTDVWALGLIAFRALTGKVFWLAANDVEFALQAVIAEVLVHPIPPASTRANELGVGDLVPPNFDAWFAGCVNRATGERFANAREAWRALAPLLGARVSLETPISAPGSGPTGTAPGTPMPSGVVANSGVPATIRPSAFGTGNPALGGATQMGPLDWQGVPPFAGGAASPSATFTRRRVPGWHAPASGDDQPRNGKWPHPGTCHGGETSKNRGWNVGACRRRRGGDRRIGRWLLDVRGSLDAGRARRHTADGRLETEGAISFTKREADAATHGAEWKTGLRPRNRARLRTHEGERNLSLSIRLRNASNASRRRTARPKGRTPWLSIATS